MPLSFPTLDKPLVDESPETIERLASRAFLQGQVQNANDGRVAEGFQPLLPIPAFAGHMGGMGHCNIFSDVDGAVRRDALVIKYQGQYFPSMALELARVALGVKPETIQIALADHLQMGKYRLPLDEESRFFIKFRGPFSDIKRVSAVDVLRDEGGISLDAFKN
jgi:CHASE2 domain-containing sensor protein